jgi:hypothetical protein
MLVLCVYAILALAVEIGEIRALLEPIANAAARQAGSSANP